jgi:hypothetical protein
MNTAVLVWDQLANQASVLAADQVDPESQRLLREIAERYEKLASRARDQAKARSMDPDEPLV